MQRNAYLRRWQASKPQEWHERRRAQKRTYESEHREQKRARSRQFYWRHRDEMLLQMAAYQQEHREELRARRITRYWNNRDSMIAKARRYWANHKDVLNEKRNAKNRARQEYGRVQRTSEERERIAVELRNRGLTQKEISEWLGVTDSAVAYILKRAGHVTPRCVSEERQQARRNLENEVAGLRAEGRSWKEIKEITGRSAEWCRLCYLHWLERQQNEHREA